MAGILTANGSSEPYDTERQDYRQTMDEIYRLIDTTLNMVIIRLGDMLPLEDDQQFLKEEKT